MIELVPLHVSSGEKSTKEPTAPSRSSPLRSRARQRAPEERLQVARVRTAAAPCDHRQRRGTPPTGWTGRKRKTKTQAASGAFGAPGPNPKSGFKSRNGTQGSENHSKWNASSLDPINIEAFPGPSHLDKTQNELEARERDKAMATT